jgi:hypothetical protein
MSDIDPIEQAAHEQRRADNGDRSKKLAALTEVEDIKWLMSSKRGRRIVRRLLEHAGVHRLSFHTNALQMAFNEGNRNLGNRLLAQVTQHCPDRYLDLLNEDKDQ